MNINISLPAAIDNGTSLSLGTLYPNVEDAKKVVGQEKFIQYSKECADKSITLVKEEKGVLPISPDKYHKILFYPLEQKDDGLSIFGSGLGANQKFLNALRAQGFEVDVFDGSGGFEGMMKPISEVVDKYDLIIYAASLQTKSNQTVVRIEWQNPMGVNAPTYCHSVPTIFVSFENPYHLVNERLNMWDIN